MKVIDAIHEADALKANVFSQKAKITWLSRLDQRIKLEVFDTHLYNDGEEEITFTGYTPDDGEKELLVHEPYAELYIHWLEAQIDYSNMEYDGFNAANAMFEAVYEQFRNHYNETHKPRGRKKTYF